jgi:hypothetical protein
VATRTVVDYSLHGHRRYGEYPACLYILGTEQELAKLLKKPNMHTCDFTEYRCWVMVNYTRCFSARFSPFMNSRIQQLPFELLIFA